MPTVTVRGANIPYSLRRSSRARRLRIVVTPGRVEVVAPLRVKDAQIQAFVDSKSHWLHDNTEALRERSLDAVPPRFVDGAQVLFRGQFRKLRVEKAAVRKASLRYASAFDVRVPSNLSGDEQEQRARRLVVSWLRNRAREDARAIIRQFEPQLGVGPAALRIGSQKTLWGSCSSRNVISLNWRLMAAPRTIYEYVVAHEMCHLRERNHSVRFWRLVETLVPDYRERRAWLKRHGVGLG